MLSRIILSALILGCVLLTAAEPPECSAFELPDSYTVTIDSIEYIILDAFEGSKVNTRIEKNLFRLGNSLHLKTRVKTVNRLVLFAAGDSVNRKILVETERNLRRVSFIADARICISESKGLRIAKIYIYDQWTTTPGTSIKRLGSTWTYWFGIKESNLFGSGQTVSFSYHKGLLDTYRSVEYYNPVYSKKRLRYYLLWMDLNSGYQVAGNLSRPLRSKSDIVAYAIAFSRQLSDSWLFWNANLFDEIDQGKLPESVVSGESASIIRYNQIESTSINGSYTRSYGSELKADISGFISIYRRIYSGTFNYIHGLENILDLDKYHLPEYDDNIVGIKLNVYRTAYRTTVNFRRLKWTEDLETGTALSISSGINFDQVDNKRELYLAPRFAFSEMISSNNFVAFSLESRWFQRKFKGKNRGRFVSRLEWINQVGKYNSNYLAVNWDHLFNSHPTEQLTLGEYNGLYGYPNNYYSGQARIKFLLETRLIPNIEVFTVTPALTAFFTAGNTFPKSGDFDIELMHKSVGIGFRLALTRSANSVINHLNVSWPLESGLPGPVWSIQSKTSL